VKIRFSPRARDHIRSAVEHLPARNPVAARELKDQILSTIERLAGGEFEGPELRLLSGAVVRSWPVLPHRIYYQRSAGILRMFVSTTMPAARSRRGSVLGAAS
jgi:plasmid stabilization system protein ParE